MCITVSSVDLLAPTNIVPTVESCDTVTLQWTQPSVPNDITTSVSCTPPSPGCAECTTSPCTITGLNPSTEYEFTVTLNSGGCRANMSTTETITRDEILIFCLTIMWCMYVFLASCVNHLFVGPEHIHPLCYCTFHCCTTTQWHP